MRKPRLKLVARLAALTLLAGASSRAAAQWTNLPGFPSGNTFHCNLLTDGTVMCHQYDSNHWHRLVPDQNGSYTSGTWDPNTTQYPNIPDMPNGTDSTVACTPTCTYAPRFFSSVVMNDGRVVVIGGEYNSGAQTWTNIGFVYDPVTNKWSSQIAEAFGTGNVGDAQTVVLTDGTLLMANISNSQIESYDPTTLTFTALATPTGHPNKNDEEGWNILPDGTVLAVSASTDNTFYVYDPTTDAWTSSATMPVTLGDTSTFGGSAEIGPAVLRPDGTVIYFSGNSSGQNAVYTLATGAWSHTTAMDFPVNSGTSHFSVADGSASLLPGGHVIVMASPVTNTSPFNTPSHFYEWDGTNLTAVTDAANAGSFKSYQGSFLILPTGEVMLAAYDQGSTQTLQVYSNGAGPNDAWRPVITAAPKSVSAGTTFAISGQMVNGFSEGAAYGDDGHPATNYPIVRITNRGTGHVFYARTHDHSRMGVEAVGSTQIVSTLFDTPQSLESGLSDLEIVANGIPSKKWVVNGPGLTLPGPIALDACVGTSATAVLNICNTGAQNLNINNITSSSAAVTVDNPGFTIVISPDFCFPFQVHFVPTSAGTTNATLTITSNDPNTPTATVAVTATSAAPSIATSLANGGVFPNTCPAGFSDAPVLYVTNASRCNLSISSVTSSSADFLPPTTSPTSPIVVPASGTVTLPIRFAPQGQACSDTIARTGNVTIASNDPSNPSVVQAVSGVVPCPHINATIANSGGFGNVCAGNQADLSLQVLNQGQCNLNITSLASSNPQFQVPTVGLPLVLSHDSSASLPIRFQPTGVCSDTVPRTSNISITSNDPAFPTFVQGVSGIEGCPKIVLSPNNLTGIYAFPATVSDPTGNLGCYTDRQITIANAGVCPLNITALSAGPTNTFNVINPAVPLTIAPGASPVPVTIRFKPTNLTGQLANAPDQQTGTFTITSNDPVGPSASLCGEPTVRSGIRVLVTNSTSQPVNPLKSLTVQSNGLSPQFAIRLSNVSTSSTSICGNPPIVYHLDAESLPPAGTTGSNPKASYTLTVQNNVKPISTSFTLGQCEMKSMVLQYQ